MVSLGIDSIGGDAGVLAAAVGRVEAGTAGHIEVRLRV
jgi:hypothetical protein